MELLLSLMVKWTSRSQQATRRATTRMVTERATRTTASLTSPPQAVTQRTRTQITTPQRPASPSLPTTRQEREKTKMKTKIRTQAQSRTTRTLLRQQQPFHAGCAFLTQTTRRTTLVTQTTLSPLPPPPMTGSKKVQAPQTPITAIAVPTPPTRRAIPSLNLTTLPRRLMRHLKTTTTIRRAPRQNRARCQRGCAACSPSDGDGGKV